MLVILSRPVLFVNSEYLLGLESESNDFVADRESIKFEETGHEFRQPSFGLQNLNYFSSENEKKNMRNMSQSKNEKFSQTESNHDLLSIINDKDFLDGLKVIGKFVKFLNNS